MRFYGSKAHGSEDKRFEVRQCLHHTPSEAPFNLIIKQTHDHGEDAEVRYWWSELAAMTIDRDELKR
jgi:hypothetical protein